MLSPSIPFAATGKIPITTKSEEARAAYVKGRDLFEKLRAAESRDQFKQAVALDPSFAMGLFQLANTQPTAREFNETLARAKAASVGVSKGEQMRSPPASRAATATTPSSAACSRNSRPRTRRTSAWTASDGDRRPHIEAGAIKAYEPALKIAPSYSQPYNQLGYAYRFLGEMDKAEATFKKYVELIPDDPNPYDSYAELLLKRGRYDESIANYRKALAVDPHFVASHVGIATDYHINETPMLEQPHFQRREANSTYITKEDWPEVDANLHPGRQLRARRRLRERVEGAVAPVRDRGRGRRHAQYGRGQGHDGHDRARAGRPRRRGEAVRRGGLAGRRVDHDSGREPREPAALPGVPQGAGGPRPQRRRRREEVDRHVRHRGERLGQRGTEEAGA
jgi:tetratricopeptide (TPR) repeat protein